MHFAANLYLFEEEERAMQILRDNEDPSNTMFKLAECYLRAADGAEPALLQDVNGIMEERPDPFYLYHGLCIWLLSGNLSIAKSRARALLQAENDLPTSFQVMLKYIAGEIDRSGFSDTYRPRWADPDVNYCIAMKELAEGDRDIAVEHFQKCADRDAPSPVACTWAKAFLERLKDNSWPNWIRSTVKEGPETSAAPGVHVSKQGD
jgi:hypothetical protein